MGEQASMQQQLIFLISTPRSGSTLLMRVLNSTSAVHSRPEPHLLPPLAHLGFWETVEKAPYDQLQAQQAIRQLVAELPNGDLDYFNACRQYTDSIYRQIFDAHKSDSEHYFLDKTPANALVLPFLKRLYPKAKYIVLTRHPAAIFASYADSFFDGDFKAAKSFNPILSRYIPVVADFIRDDSISKYHISYEDLVQHPEKSLREISAYLDIPYEEAALNYQQAGVAEGLGDPLGVAQHQRPVTNSIHKWTAALSSPENFEIVASQLAGVSEEDLRSWGSPKNSLWDRLDDAHSSGVSQRKKKWNRYLLTRKILIWLRRDINNRALGRIIKKLRFYCDVLLRG